MCRLSFLREVFHFIEYGRFFRTDVSEDLDDLGSLCCLPFLALPCDGVSLVT